MRDYQGRSEFDIAPRERNRARLLRDAGVDIDAPFLTRVGQGFQQQIPTLLNALNAVGVRGAMPSPRFRPTDTVEAYHGTPRWEGDAIRTPFWMHESPGFPHRFSGESGAILPLEVDASNYLYIRDGSRLQRLDDAIGHGRHMERLTPGGRNWLADIARGTGYSGIRWESNFHDYGPVLMAFDPRTVRGRYGAFTETGPTTGQRPYASPPPSYPRDEETAMWWGGP